MSSTGVCLIYIPAKFTLPDLIVNLYISEHAQESDPSSLDSGRGLKLAPPNQYNHSDHASQEKKV